MRERPVLLVGVATEALAAGASEPPAGGDLSRAVCALALGGSGAAWLLGVRSRGSVQAARAWLRSPRPQQAPTALSGLTALLWKQLASLHSSLGCTKILPLKCGEKR